jgi:hypothetical protein
MTKNGLWAAINQFKHAIISLWVSINFWHMMCSLIGFTRIKKI